LVYLFPKTNPFPYVVICMSIVDMYLRSASYHVFYILFFLIILFYCDLCSLFPSPPATLIFYPSLELGCLLFLSRILRLVEDPSSVTCSLLHFDAPPFVPFSCFVPCASLFPPGPSSLNLFQLELISGGFSLNLGSPFFFPLPCLCPSPPVHSLCQSLSPSLVFFC